MRTIKILCNSLFIIVLFSCNTSRISRSDLIKENKSLKENLARFEAVDTSKIDAVLELSKMNVVYRGVSNPIKITVPNAVKFEAIAPGLKKVDEFGNYIMTPGSGLKVDVVVKGVMISGDTITYIKALRIKNIGKPIGTINDFGCGSKCIIELTKEELINGEIGVKIQDFAFDMDFIVNKFKIKFSKNPTIVIEGTELNEKAKELVNEMKLNDIIYIFDISPLIKGNSSYKLKRVSPIKIKIVK